MSTGIRKHRGGRGSLPLCSLSVTQHNSSVLDGTSIKVRLKRTKEPYCPVMDCQEMKFDFAFNSLLYRKPPKGVWDWRDVI